MSQRSVMRNGGMRFRMTPSHDLIRAALQQNYDVRIAAARILEARAQLGIVRADQWPGINAVASVTNERSPEVAGRPPVETSPAQITGSFAWELDFWGKFRRATESARASLLSEEWAQRQIISSLVSDLAIAYFQLREQDLELEISRRTLASRRDSLRLTQLLADRGATSMLDVRQAEQLVYGAGASIPDLERRIEQQENFISILVGRNPESIARGRPLVDQPHPPDVPAGLPSSLLERRPDILQAEQQLVAANAQIGVAKADYFPQISLTAVGGSQSSALTRLFAGPAGSVDRRRRRPATGLRRREDSKQRQVCRSSHARSDARLSTHGAAGVSRSCRCAGWISEKPGGQDPATAADKRCRRRDQVVEHALRARRRKLSRSPGQRDEILCRSTRARAGPAPRAAVAGRDLSLSRRRMAAVSIRPAMAGSTALYEGIDRYHRPMCAIHDF